MIPLVAISPRNGGLVHEVDKLTGYVEVIKELDSTIRKSRASTIDDFENLLETRYLQQKHLQRSALVSQFLLPPDVKSMIIAHITGSMSMSEICRFVLDFCATNKDMCSTEMWDAIATTILQIPTLKPVDVRWNAWISLWCTKLTAYSPWSATIFSTRDLGTNIEDMLQETLRGTLYNKKNVLDFSKPECIWRLKNTKPVPILYYDEKTGKTNTLRVNTTKLLFNTSTVAYDEKGDSFIQRVARGEYYSDTVLINSSFAPFWPCGVRNRSCTNASSFSANFSIVTFNFRSLLEKKRASAATSFL